MEWIGFRCHQGCAVQIGRSQMLALFLLSLTKSMVECLIDWAMKEEGGRGADFVPDMACVK